MTRWNVTTVREQFARAGDGATRVYTVASRQPSWVTRVAVMAALAAMTAIALLIIVPALLIGLLVFLGAAAFVSVKRVLTRPFQTNGALDGRKNVRVVVRETDGPL